MHHRLGDNPSQDYTTLRVLAIPVRGHVGLSRLTLDLDHLGYRETAVGALATQRPRDMLRGPRAEEYLTQKTRHGAHTESFTKRRSNGPISEGSPAQS